MALTDLVGWMDEYGVPGAVWFAKRLAANDTLATGAHGAGPYIPKEFLFSVFPELNHNEMNGWVKNLGPFYFIFLNDADDSAKIKKRMAATADLLQKTGWPVESINIEGQDALAQLFWASVLGDWVSYHLALFYGVDPTPVEMVEELKKRLKE